MKKVCDILMIAAIILAFAACIPVEGPTSITTIAPFTEPLTGGNGGLKEISMPSDRTFEGIYARFKKITASSYVNMTISDKGIEKNKAGEDAFFIKHEYEDGGTNQMDQIVRDGNYAGYGMRLDHEKNLNFMTAVFATALRVHDSELYDDAAYEAAEKAKIQWANNGKSEWITCGAYKLRFVTENNKTCFLAELKEIVPLQA